MSLTARRRERIGDDGNQKFIKTYKRKSQKTPRYNAKRTKSTKSGKSQKERERKLISNNKYS